MFSVNHNAKIQIWKHPVKKKVFFFLFTKVQGRGRWPCSHFNTLSFSFSLFFFTLLSDLTCRGAPFLDFPWVFVHGFNKIKLLKFPYIIIAVFLIGYTGEPFYKLWSNSKSHYHELKTLPRLPRFEPVRTKPNSSPACLYFISKLLWVDLIFFLEFVAQIIIW